MTHAPVIIPTLCRYDHFRQCLESLMSCTGASETVVYIGLDYPAKQSHVDGWQKIDKWLKTIEQKNPFKQLIVVRRDRNYGFGENGNSQTLRREVFRQYDRIIFSEDDNVFSPAFLDFINKGLEKFKDDRTVMAINGYRHYYNVKFDNNTFFRQNVDFSAWGYGIWRDRYEVVNSTYKSNYWRKKALNPVSWYRIMKNGWNRTLGFIRLTMKTSVPNDNIFSVFMGINKMDVVMPVTSMVRNMGWDGSGEHCTDANISHHHMSQSIFEGSSFDFSGCDNNYNANHMIFVNESYGRISFIQFIKKMIFRIS